MTPIKLSAIDDAIATATHSGALQTIRTEHTLIEDGGITFLVRWVSSLAVKDASRVIAAGRRDPDFNPFLPPERDLTVGTLGPAHLAVLNKYPVIARHLLIVTRTFEDQSAPLTLADFSALACVIGELGGLGFYNGGLAAGASQRHKHLQWIPDASDGVRLHGFTRGLPQHQPVTTPTHHPALAWRHSFVRMPETMQSTNGAAGRRLHQAFRLACASLGIDPDSNPMPPFNMLTDGVWMLVIPRSRERHADISVNALGFAGSLFVRRPEQIDTVRQLGPLQLLAAVACR
jgi:ATP adenylyltransferase